MSAKFDWKTFGDEVVGIVKDAIGAALSPVTERLDALEARTPERGEKGEPGEKGEKGDTGEKGEPGKAGPQGEPGPRGDSGGPGEKGPIGEPGAKGEPGRDGRDGAPGRDGNHGVDGRPGEHGKDGAPGRDGKDGLGFDDIIVEHDGERGFKFAFVRGDQRKEFGAFIVPSMIYRGVWKDGAYQKGDTVTWAGSMFVAEKDTESKPETKDSDWRLSVKRGKDGANGKDGKPGERGADGPPGRDGRVYS